ncbi:IS4 family transposase [Streptomyces sp. NPDC093248]|uniref:IS4 family transposase n=1 Tax=Streptomyces sp. NPDC093248 TaxID=3155072 RepID=UPI00341564C3
MVSPAVVTVPHVVTAAEGVFAPGHLGELTQYLPFDLVDAVLKETKTTERRLRDLPSRVGVYFVLALALFPSIGYARVWGKLVTGLHGLVLPRPSEKALRDLRRRLGPAPIKALFEVVAGPLARPQTRGVCHHGRRIVAFDGCNSLRVPDTQRNRNWLGKVHRRLGWAAYPTLRLVALVATGTRGLIGAAVGAAGDGDEVAFARRLLHHLGPGMLVLLDRAYDANGFLRQLSCTGARFLARAKSTRNPVVIATLPDGSYLSRLDGMIVRIVDAELTMRGTDGTRVHDRYFLITTLLDHRRDPAADLVRLYHERWEIETAFLALRHTILNGRVLRSQDRMGLEQEVWSLLVLYQLLRAAMVTAVETQPGTDPDRACFTTALEAARDQVVLANGIVPAQEDDFLGVIGRAVLATLLPARRPRYSARKVKSATSRYLNRDSDRPFKTTTVDTISVMIRTSRRSPNRSQARRAGTAPGTPHIPQRPTRRQRVTAIMSMDPKRAWDGRELAEKLGLKPKNLLTQLGEWVKLGFLVRASTATYSLIPETTTSSTTPNAP